MPKWLVGEIGYVLAIIGFMMIVREWWQVYRAQGNALAREDLRVHLREWRKAEDEPTRTASIRRMEETLPEILDDGHRELFAGYIAMLSTVRPHDVDRVDEIDTAFHVGSPLEEKRWRPSRRTLMFVGVVLVIVGTVGQAISTWPKPFWQFCESKEWQC